MENTVPNIENFTPDQQDQIIQQTLFVRKSNIALQEYLIHCIGEIQKCVTEYKIVIPENREIVELLKYLKEKQEKSKEASESMDALMNKMAANNNILLEDEIPKNIRWW